MADQTPVSAPAPVDTKSPLLSKTLWFNLIIAALALFYPPAAAWIQAHSDLFVVIVSVINMILRVVTKTGIQIGD